VTDLQESFTQRGKLLKESEQMRYELTRKLGDLESLKVELLSVRQALNISEKDTARLRDALKTTQGSLEWSEKERARLMENRVLEPSKPDPHSEFNTKPVFLVKLRGDQPVRWTQSALVYYLSKWHPDWESKVEWVTAL
jgi:hypothetical protein